jgi:hypothetical protein
MRVGIRVILLLLFSSVSVPRLAGQGAPNPVPQINQPTEPMTAAPGGGVFTLNVYGAGFIPTSTVRWNGSARLTTFVSAAHVTAAIPVSDIATKGTAFVTVFNPPPGGGSSNVLYFGITNPASSLAFAASFPTSLNSLVPQGGFFSVAVGDFNGDGKVDLAIALGGSVSTVVLMLGNGDGTFQAPVVSYPTGPDPQAIVACDVNGDGKLDLLIQNTDDTLTILLGNGDGTFQPKAPVSGNHQFAVGDFNRDGKLDLAIDANGGGIAILLGNGDGTFQSPVGYGSGPVAPGAVGDFNGDGIVDILTSGSFLPGVPLDPVILLGKGDGTFQVAPNPTGLHPTVQLVADLNGDGKLDVEAEADVFPNCSQGWQLGNGDGTFQTATAGFGCGGGRVGDLNGDGKLDMAVSFVSGQPGIVFLSGNGDGTFQNPVVLASNLGVSLNPLAIADLNGDGQMDVVAEDDRGKLWILLQGLLPVDTPSPASVSFGTQSVGISSAPQTVTLTNTGTAALTFSGSPVSISGTDAAMFSQTHTCGSSLAIGANCQVQVTFTPTLGGPRSAVLNIADDGVGSPLAIPLSGTTPTVSTVVLSSTTLGFASQPAGTTSPPQSVTLTNGGGAVLSNLSISTVGGNAADFAQTNTCNSSVAIGASCQINVTFTPTLGAGTEIASVSIVDNAADSPQVISLTGATPAAGVGSLSPSSITFPSQFVGTSGLPKTVTLTNTGTATLSIASITASPADFGVLSACANGLMPGQSCAIGVFFDPTAGGGRTGTLTVAGDGINSPQRMALTGIGQDFSVGSSGAASATITAGQTATYTLVFAPMGGFTQPVALSCSGAPPQSTCTVTPSSLPLSGASVAMATVMVTTTRRSAGFRLPFGVDELVRTNYRPMWLLAGLLAMLMIVSLFAGSQEQQLRRWAPVLAFALLLCAGMTLTSCGGGSGGSGGGGTSGTLAGTYTITVSGTFAAGSTTLTHNTKLTLVVQ